MYCFYYKTDWSVSTRYIMKLKDIFESLEADWIEKCILMGLCPDTAAPLPWKMPVHFFKAQLKQQRNVQHSTRVK